MQHCLWSFQITNIKTYRIFWEKQHLSLKSCAFYCCDQNIKIHVAWELREKLSDFKNLCSKIHIILLVAFTRSWNKKKKDAWKSVWLDFCRNHRDALAFPRDSTCMTVQTRSREISLNTCLLPVPHMHQNTNSKISPAFYDETKRLSFVPETFSPSSFGSPSSDHSGSSSSSNPVTASLLCAQTFLTLEHIRFLFSLPRQTNTVVNVALWGNQAHLTSRKWPVKEPGNERTIDWCQTENLRGRERKEPWAWWLSYNIHAFIMRAIRERCVTSHSQMLFWVHFIYLSWLWENWQ